MARILVIDDDESIRELVARSLKHDHEVLTASDGEEGMRICREDPVELVVTDIFMPDMDGLEITGRLMRECPHIKVIAISGGGDMGKLDFLKAAEAFGAALSLSKPFTVDELREAVRDILAS